MKTANPIKDKGSGTYNVGRKYPIIEVLSWWIEPMTRAPAWLPVMGSIHEDTDAFRFDKLHYHVDPRFTNDDTEPRIERWLGNPWRNNTDLWHPAYHEILAHFPHPDDSDLFFSITTGATEIGERSTAINLETETMAWGRERIRTRRRTRVCRRPLPQAIITANTPSSFSDLRKAYPDPKW